MLPICDVPIAGPPSHLGFVDATCCDLETRSSDADRVEGGWPRGSDESDGDGNGADCDFVRWLRRSGRPHVGTHGHGAHSCEDREGHQRGRSAGSRRRHYSEAMLANAIDESTGQ